VAERSIIQSAWQVRALLDGRRTQIRVPVKPQPISKQNGWFEWGYAIGAPRASSPRVVSWNEAAWAKCGTAPIDAYGPFAAGDLLWVRETWAALDDDYRPVQWPHDLRGGPWSRVAYQADHIDPRGDGPAHPMRWRPSTQMPRWAARIWLRVTGVRVERVQDISEEDARAEGHRGSFEYEWNEIHGWNPNSWDANPWVWVATVERTSAPDGER